MVFNHSVKVPTQYKKAAAVFRKVINEKKSVRSLIYEEKHAKVPNLLALINKYSENKDIIENLIDKSKILADNPRLDPFLCRVLTTELIFGTKNLKGESKPVLCVLSYKEKFEELKSTETDINQTSTSTDKTSVKKPRYVRVNTNKLTVEDFLKKLDEENWKNVTKQYETYDEYLNVIKSLNEDEYAIDVHINTIFVFHPKWRNYWASHEYAIERKIILQDKATCLASELLNPTPNSVVLDMCAAPGMKTIHMSNIMKNSGIIYAVERNQQRYNTLREMTLTANATNVQTINSDALEITKNDAKDVEYILVDPSCSGSGMQSRISLGKEEKDSQRLFKLSRLQAKFLEHAMSEFPNVKRIVYSTCSIYPEENEEVVEWCLKKFPNFKLLSGKKALRRLWKNVGSKDYKGIGKNCIYSLPQDDYTDGIFIAIFEKIENDED